VTAFDYESPGDLLISLYKSRGRYELAELLAALIVRAVDASAEPLPLNTVFVPIPSASTSLRRRGFNPAAELARALARQTGKPLAGDWLDRRRDGPKQSMLSRLDRLQSARQMYHCPKPIPTCTVAIVDDVMTTGSTLHAAASALQEAGAMTLIGVVAARTPLEDGGTLAQYRLP
jgi:ComF family protein